VNIPGMGKPGNAFRASQSVSSAILAPLRRAHVTRTHLDFKEALMREVKSGD